MGPNHELLLNLATPAFLLSIVAFCLLIFWENFRRFAKENQALSLSILGGLAVFFSVFASLAYQGAGNTLTIIVIAALLLGASSRVILKETPTAQSRAINAPSRGRLIDKIAPSRGLKILAWIVINLLIIGGGLFILDKGGLVPYGSPGYGYAGIIAAALSTLANASLYWIKK